MLYNISIEDTATTTTTLMRVGFDDPGTNDEIVREVRETLSNLPNLGGKLCRVTGPASMPVAGVLIHHLAHLFGAIGVFDPKLQKFVVVVSHDPDFVVGDLI